MSRTLCAVFLGLLLPAAMLAAAEGRLEVHEWGTFTSLQDDRGDAIRGINVDDEPLPRFVHRLAWRLLFDAEVVPGLMKGVPRAHPHITLRLETPVLYFHPPPGWDEHTEVDVEVAFRGGWLTEYYPDAEVEAPGIVGSGNAESMFGPLREDTLGTLAWNGLRLGVDATPLETDAHVWLAPRAVDAADVAAANGESERYLFYRGVAHRDAPVRVLRDEARDLLRLAAHPTALDEVGPLVIAEHWLVDIRADGTVAFRTLPAWTAWDPGLGPATPASFAEVEYSRANLDLLRTAMHRSLVAAGLFDDEATAMLRTWELSYFLSPGTRYFFVVPRVWTDYVLPLRLSVAADVERVMVGRVELVTPRQRQLLRWIAAGPQRRRPEEAAPPPDDRWEIPLPRPVDHHLFLQLGRFRHALLLREQLKRPTAALDRFMETYGITYYVPRP